MNAPLETIVPQVLLIVLTQREALTVDVKRDIKGTVYLVKVFFTIIHSIFIFQIKTLLINKPRKNQSDPDS
jgi:hypothetical protein